MLVNVASWLLASFAPSVLVILALYAVLYGWRFRNARREAGSRGASARHAIAFGAALIVLAVALASPLDPLGDRLFSAHMAQHVLLGDIAPLLLLLALSRVIMRPATRRLVAIERALGRFASPLTGLAVWLVLLYLWHIPALYVAAIENPALHVLEHASFFTAGVALWWPLVQPVPMRHRLTGLSTFAYVGAAKAGLAALGLYLTWASTLAYPYYARVPSGFGLTPIEDQNVGGALMMLEQSIVLVIVFCVLFARMLTHSEEEQRRRERLEDAAAARALGSP